MKQLTLVVAVLSAAWCFTFVRSQAQAPPAGVYHQDPQHLWNRLHEALFVRHDAAGREYGRDRLEPLLWRRSKHLHGPSHERLLSTLNAFLRDRGDRQAVSPLHRAMLQRDLWLVFSWLEHSHDEFYGFGGTAGDWIAARERLRGPLAAAIGRLALDAREIARLPDTYADAVASRAFAPVFDAAHPDRPYLPLDLFAAGGPWVPLGRGNELIAPAHVLTDNPFTNSVFLVFLKLPGGRAATRAFVERLAAFQGPLYVRPSGGQQPEYPYFNPSTPQFPAGTEVALVRRALLVTAAGELAVSPIAESIQVRRYRDVAALASPDAFLLATLVTDRTRASQTAFELTLSRRRLFAGQAGGLADEPGDAILTGFSTHGVDPFEEGHVTRLSNEQERSVRSRICITCHSLPGVFSFNTFAQNFSATPERRGSRLAAAAVEDVLASGMRWKRQRPDWLLLRRLMTDTAQPERALLLQPDHPEMTRRAPDVSHIRLETTKGMIRLEMRREWAPLGVDRFYNLARHGYYDDAAVFRIRAGTWAQFGINGEPKIAQAWRSRTIPDDPRVLSNVRGTVACAFKDPHGRTTQVFINLRDNSATHDQEPFVPFAKVVEGMEARVSQE